jgi:RNA polymerase sigma-70 factor (ECF subfamily)
VQDKRLMALPIDRNLVDRLVVEHLPAVFGFAQRLTGDSHSAEEVTQETLCRVLKRWRSFRGDAAFKTWMMQIVVNVDRDRRRRKSPEQLSTDTAACGLASPAEDAMITETSDAIRAAIDRLPDRQREVAVLSLGEGMAASEVAAVLGISEANVHSTLHLARKRIAQAIGFDYVSQS